MIVQRLGCSAIQNKTKLQLTVRHSRGCAIKAEGIITCNPATDYNENIHLSCNMSIWQPPFFPV